MSIRGIGGGGALYLYTPTDMRGEELPLLFDEILLGLVGFVLLECCGGDDDDDDV